MARPLRIEIPGGFYHVMARGNEKADIYKDDVDRERFLFYLAKTVERNNWYCHAYCLMPNHYHLLIELKEKNLSRGAQYLNGSYAQFFNHRHKRVGHLFQGRAKIIIIDKNSHFLELTRYIALNPVRSRLVYTADQYFWSSYRATVNLEPRPNYLTTDGMLINYGNDRAQAIKRYKEFVSAGKNQPSPFEKLKNQLYLGSDEFIKQTQKHINKQQSLDDIPRQQQRAPAQPLNIYKSSHPNKNQAMAEAYISGHYTLKQIADFFSVSKSTVSRTIHGVRPPIYPK